MERLMRELRWHIHTRRRLVMARDPFSPLFPFVSSTLLIESIWNSPGRIASCGSAVSKRISRSYQTPSSSRLSFFLRMPGSDGMLGAMAAE